MGSKSNWIHRTTLESPSSTISSGAKVKHHSRESMRHPIKSKESNKLAEWHSHLNMQQLVKNRTKLKTPNSDESIEAYAKACRAKFNRKCSEVKSDHGMKRITNNGRSKDQPIYTKPYSSDSYSDIQNVQRSNEDRIKGKQSDAYTSVSGSDGFLSPNSISIGVAANSTSNTTTHQYDTKISVGLQTTNTLERMPMIQLKKPIDEPKVKEPTEQPTVRVNKLTINKQLQVRPEALAYIIMFKEDDDENGNSKKSQGQERGNQLYANAKKIDAIGSSSNSSSSSSSSDSDAQNGRSKRSDVKEQFRERTTSNSSSIASVDNLTLQECLRERRPDFYANAEQRRKCLNDLHNLR